MDFSVLLVPSIVTKYILRIPHNFSATECTPTAGCHQHTMASRMSPSPGSCPPGLPGSRSLRVRTGVSQRLKNLHVDFCHPLILNLLFQYSSPQIPTVLEPQVSGLCHHHPVTWLLSPLSPPSSFMA